MERRLVEGEGAALTEAQPGIRRQAGGDALTADRARHDELRTSQFHYLDAGV